MSQFQEKHARNLVIMLTAGGKLEDVLEMAKSFGIRATHVQQLATPIDERSSQRFLIKALKKK